MTKKMKETMIEAAKTMWAFGYPTMSIDVHVEEKIYVVEKMIDNEQNVSYSVRKK